MSENTAWSALAVVEKTGILVKFNPVEFDHKL
jgi:hypothetical protein